MSDNRSLGWQFWTPIGVSVALAVVSMCFAVWRDHVSLVQSAFVEEVQKFIELESELTTNVYDFTAAVLSGGKAPDQVRQDIHKAVLAQLSAAQVISDRLEEADKSLLTEVEAASLNLRRAIDETDTRDQLRGFYVSLEQYLHAKRQFSTALRMQSGATG